MTSSIYYHNMANENAENQDVNLAPITTEEFFEVGSEDRLYWWREDGDVVIDDRTRLWLEQMAEQHRSHIETMSEEFSAVEWHERLVRFLGKYNVTVKMFDVLYHEFLNSFHLKEYRAWIEMMEVLVDNDTDKCRKLIAVLSNEDLRKRVFGL